MLHGIFKASLFLGSGSVINHARSEPNIPRKLTYELFWKEKQNKASKKQMLRYITIFTIVPILIFIGAKLIIGEDFFQLHAAVIILAFAALTGTQLFLSFLKASQKSSPKVLFYLITAFAFVILSYEVFGLALEHYLYPVEAHLFYEAATKHVTGTMILVVLALIMMIGWYFMYKKHFFDTPKNPQEPNERKWMFYKILAKEAYFSKFFVKYIKIF
jgi:NADH-quinone oxidoreductase subunit L